MKKIRIKIVLIIILLILLIMGLFVLENLKNRNEFSDVQGSENNNIVDITWDEYQNLTPDEQALFPDRFENMDDYNNWYNDNNPNLKDNELGNEETSIENPEKYTWDDYQKLTAEEKATFPDSFANLEDYKKWYDSVNPNSKENDSQNFDSSEKAPELFTWDEYQKLTIDEKAVFPDRFKNMEEYNKWYNSVNPNLNNNDIPLLDLHNKKPELFTWDEYQKLTIDEKAIFPDCFESMESYKKWYESVKPKE